VRRSNPVRELCGRMFPRPALQMRRSGPLGAIGAACGRFGRGARQSGGGSLAAGGMTRRGKSGNNPLLIAAGWLWPKLRLHNPPGADHQPAGASDVPVHVQSDWRRGGQGQGRGGLLPGQTVPTLPMPGGGIRGAALPSPPRLREWIFWKVSNPRTPGSVGREPLPAGPK
jgi:hypothetical protein